MLDYWRAVEESTQTYLARLDDAELARVVTVEDWPPDHQRFKVDGLLWHLLIHEMRHTAQIAVLWRSQGINPPCSICCFICRPANDHAASARGSR